MVASGPGVSPKFCTAFNSSWSEPPSRAPDVSAVCDVPVGAEVIN